jgi:hypothetical protein
MSKKSNKIDIPDNVESLGDDIEIFKQRVMEKEKQETRDIDEVLKELIDEYKSIME